MASQNNWTPLGTPVEVIFARRKNASAITITAAIAVDRIVSVLTVIPSHVAWLCSPTSIAALGQERRLSHRWCFFLPFLPIPRSSAAAPRSRSFFQTGSAVDSHQQHLEKRQAEHHAQARRAGKCRR